jgi:integrase/recombinase XerD
MKWIAPRTNKQYKQLGRRILAYWEDDKFTQASVDNFYMELVKGTRPGNNVNVIYRAFIKNYIACYEDDVYDSGARRIKLVDVGSRSRKKVDAYKFLTYEELLEMLSHLQSPQILVMVKLMFETGLRASEITSIKREDIDMIENNVSGIGKGNKEFRIVFSEEMGDLLRQWFKISPMNEYPFKIMQRDKPLICLNQGNALHRYMAKELRAKGYKHVTPHMIRHTFGHYLHHNKHFDVLDIKAALRHESISSTEIYASTTKEEVDEKIRRLVFGEDTTKPREIAPETQRYIDYAARVKLLAEKLKEQESMPMLVIYGDMRNYLKKITELIDYHKKECLPFHPSKFGLTTAIQNKMKDRLASPRIAWSIHYTDQI